MSLFGRKVRCVGLGICLLLVPILAAAEDVPAGIWSGNVQRVEEDPSNPGTLYAVSYGVHKSTDGGKTWAQKTLPELHKGDAG